MNEAIRDEELEAQGKLFKPCAEQVGKHFSVRYCKEYCHCITYFFDRKMILKQEHAKMAIQKQ